MPNYGVTSEGFSRKRLPAILTDKSSAFKAAFGENLNVSAESPEGQIIGTIAESDANLWELAEDAFNAFNPSSASGDTLSNLVLLNGISRLSATYSKAVLTAVGTAGTVIPVDSIVSIVDTATAFTTDRDATIGSSGTVLIDATADTIGEVNVSAGQLTSIDTPVTGWTSVTNADDAITGTELETDTALRARRVRSVARNSTGQVDAIFAEVSAVTGIVAVKVIENDTDTTDLYGVLPYSIRVIAQGGSNADVAKAIFIKKSICRSQGNTTVAVDDSQGIPHNIHFSRPLNTNIYVVVSITQFSDFPVNGTTLIKEAILNYVDGTTVTGRGFLLGNDVVHSELYTPVNTVLGHTVDSLYIGKSANPTGTANISIDIDELPVFTEANITVSIG